MSNRPDRLFEVECPDCKTMLTIDPRTRKIFHSVSKDEDGNTRSFEDAVKNATAGPQKAEKMFKEGLAAEEGKDERGITPKVSARTLSLQLREDG